MIVGPTPLSLFRLSCVNPAVGIAGMLPVRTGSRRPSDAESVDAHLAGEEIHNTCPGCEWIRGGVMVRAWRRVRAGSGPEVGLNTGLWLGSA